MTIGHVALGLAAGKLDLAGAGRGRWRLALYALLAVAPDLDLVPYLFGRGDLVPLGHRGATHSLLAAAVVALAVAMLLPGASRLRTFAAAFLAVASHGLVDPLVAGSYGTALLWPFSAARVDWGVQPLPETPVGLEALHGSGLARVVLELLVTSPLTAFALWPRRGAAPAAPAPTRPAAAAPERVAYEA